MEKIKAKKVYESLFVSKNNDEIISDILNLSLQDIVSKANIFYGYIDENSDILKKLPLIIQIYIKGKHHWPVFDNMHLSYSLFPKEEKYAELLFKYKGNGIHIRQYSDDDFIVFMTEKGHPLYSNKIYDYESFLNTLSRHI